MTWCHACGWNLEAPAAPERQGRFGRVSSTVARRASERLVLELSAADVLRSRLTPAKALAYALAFLVHAATLGLAVAGVLLILLPFPHILGIAGGTVLLGLAFVMRPRLGRPPTDGLVSPSEAPQLHELVRRVAAALSVQPPDVIAVEYDYNASWAVLGVRRTRVLSVGLPLLAALRPQERVALIGHELAHARNGDATSGLVVGSAVQALAELYNAVAPGDDVEGGELAYAELLVTPVMWLLSRPILGALLLELHLLHRDSHRAEYLADALAATVAGTPAMVAAHEKLLLASTFGAVVQRLAHEGTGSRDLFSEIAATFSAVPARELERRRRAARLEGARLDVTHPPTGMRLALLESRPATRALVELAEADSAAIDDELRPYAEQAQRRLTDEYRDALYF